MEKIRLSKLMSEQGLCSRREADSYIERGWVLVDGIPVTELGTRILPTQTITLTAAAREKQQSRVTLLLHKPIGFVSGQAENNYKPASTFVCSLFPIGQSSMFGNTLREKTSHCLLSTTHTNGKW